MMLVKKSLSNYKGVNILFKNIYIMPEIKISLSEYIELLEYKLSALEEAYRNDSSWNYGIDELKEEIKKLKAKL